MFVTKQLVNTSTDLYDLSTFGRSEIFLYPKMAKQRLSGQQVYFNNCRII